jgi:hypothetical protein
MSDPPRLIEKGASPLATRLLRSGREERPSRSSKRRALTALGASATLATSSTLASGATGALVSGAVKGGFSSTLLVLSAKWLVVGAVSGAATLLAVDRFTGPPNDRARVEARRAESRPPTLPRARAGSLGATTAAPATSALPSRAPAASAMSRGGALAAPDISPPRLPSLASASTPVAELPVPGPQPSLPEPTASAPPGNTDESALALEIVRVDAARRAFQAGDFGRTLLTLREYEREFPTLKLYQEVLFLRMESAHKLGDSEFAEGLARHLISDYSGSPHAARARAILSEQGLR